MQQAWDQAIWPLLYTVEQWQGGTLRFWLRGVGYYAVLAIMQCWLLRYWLT